MFLYVLVENEENCCTDVNNSLKEIKPVAAEIRDIILQVDGKTLARTSIKSINQLTKQTGKLDLVLA